MSYFSGRDGAVYLETAPNTWTKVGKATNFQLTSSQSSLDTTTLEDKDRTVIYGVRSMTGTCRVLYYQETRSDNSGNYASILFDKLVKSGGAPADSEEVNLRFAVNDGSGVNNGVAGKYTQVNTVVTSAAYSMGVGEVFAVDISFDVVGAPQFNSI